MSVTCVSCFYQIVNKHGNKYEEWFQTSLKINAPYVIFGTKESIEVVKPFRDGFPTVYVERGLTDFVTYKFKDRIETDPVHCPSVELGLVWHEKIFMLRDAAESNPYQSNVFVWVDAGLSIYREHAPPPYPFQTLSFLDHDRFNYTSCPDHKVTGTYALARLAAAMYASMYLEKLVQSQVIFTDQITWADIYSDNPNMFHQVGEGYGGIIKRFYEERVTVIIPTYNRFELLMNTIRSIQGQTYSDVEIIVVDDGSSQPQYAAHNWSGVQYIRLLVNSKTLFGYGVPGGYQRNFGIKRATGAYLAFCDDDDVWMPTKLEKQIRAMIACKCHISSTNAYVFQGIINTEKLYLPPLSSIWSLQDIQATNWVICSSAVIHRDMVDQVGVFKTMPHSEDYDYWKRIMQHTDLAYVDEPLVGYDENHGYGKMWGSSKTLVGHDMNLGYGKMGKEPKKINMMFFRPPA